MEWLANLSVKWVLVAAGVLAALRLLLATAWRRWPGALTLREFVEAGLVAVVIVFLVVRPYFFQAYFIPSESMHPTLLESDRILVNKLITRFGKPGRQDIYVFRPPKERVPDQKDYIKRVIGLPGETIEVVPTRLVVDGRTVMRFTKDSASVVAGQNFDRQPVGFTYPLRGGSVALDGNTALVAGGLDQEVRVRTYGPGDRITADRFSVYVNGKPVRSVAFGPLAPSRDLRRWGAQRRVEGVVYSVGENPKLILVRGERLELDPAHVRINGKRLDEPYLAEPPDYAMAPVRIPPRHYFMLGDNRNQSFDSHAWGPLSEEAIIGRAEFIFWPASRMRRIHR
jgi:signal peptidase I